MIVFSQILVLFLMILSGFIIRKKNIISDSGVAEMSRLVLYVSLPAMIIRAMQFEFSKERMATAVKMPLIAIVIYAFCIGISYLFVRLIRADGKTADILQLCMIFPNVGFMGYPVILSIYGEEGVFYTALFNMFFDLLLWTVGIYILNRSTDQNHEKKHILLTFLNPGTVAVVIGLLFFIFSIKLPSFIDNTLAYLAGATVPLAMICVGALLSKSKFRTILTNRKLIGTALAKMLILPGVIFVLLRLIGMTGYFLSIPVIIMAMPSAANIAIFASKQGSDDILASQGVFLTTILSLATIPLLVQLVY